MIAHFYHVHAAGKWREIVSEHLTLLADAGFSGGLCAGINGPEQAEAACVLRDGGFSVFTAESDYEAGTLNVLRSWAAWRPGVKILYTHTKGVYTNHPINDRWRQAMDSRLIGPWRVRASELDDYDAVGMHWLTPAEFDHRGVRTPFFGGNFWWARGGYLAQLPGVKDDDRYAAENWLGTGNPRVKDLSPGWPTYLH